MYISQLEQHQIDSINRFLSESDHAELVFTPEKIERLKQLTKPNSDPLNPTPHESFILMGRMYDLDNGHYAITCTSNNIGGIFESVIVTYDFEPKKLVKGELSELPTVVIEDDIDFPI